MRERKGCKGSLRPLFSASANKLVPYRDLHEHYLNSSRYGLIINSLLLRHSCIYLYHLLLGHIDIRSIVSANNSYQQLRCVPSWGWSSSWTPTTLADGELACYFNCQAWPRGISEHTGCFEPLQNPTAEEASVPEETTLPSVPSAD